VRIAIISKFKTKELLRILKSFDFDIVQKNPDFVLCYGGDGTILRSERKFPEVSKIVIKKGSSVCRKCDYTLNHLKNILKKIEKGKYKVVEENKLIVKTKNKKLIGLNEIQLHNKAPTRAIRFSLKIKKRRLEDLLGDGIIVSTPFGSTAYYSSTGGKPFKKGIGISFNNLHRKKIKSFVVHENSKIEIRITRGPAWIISDNYERFIEVDRGDRVLIRKTREKARFVEI